MNTKTNKPRYHVCKNRHGYETHPQGFRCLTCNNIVATEKTLHVDTNGSEKKTEPAAVFYFRFETVNRATNRHIIMRSLPGETLHQAHDRIRRTMPGARVFALSTDDAHKRLREMELDNASVM